MRQLGRGHALRSFLRQGEADVQFAQLLRADRRRRAHHQILGPLVHREQHDFAKILLARQQHDDAVDARGDAAVRRRPALEGAVHAAEFLQKHFFAVARDLERLLHDVGAMVADRPRRQFDSVADDVVLERLDRQRVLVLERLEPALRHRERVVRKVDSFLLLVPLVHREVDDPAELQHVLVRDAEVIADADARRARELGSLVHLVAGQKDRVARLQAYLVNECLLSLPRQELSYWTASNNVSTLSDASDYIRLASVLCIRLKDALQDRPYLRSCYFLEDDVAEPWRAFSLRPVVELVEERAGLFRRAPGGNRAHHAARLDDLLEGVEGDVLALEDLRHVGDLDRVAQVRLVDAVFEHRLSVRDQREFLRHRLAGPELLEHPAQDRLDRGEHVLLGDKTHLDVELIEFSGRAVGARVLIAETGRDLEIAVEARHHDELLELLRRLRQRVEFSRMQARRHQKVARALGAGGGQDRRLELEEPPRLHARAQGIDDAPAQHDVLMQLLAAKIKEAVFEPSVLRVRLVAENRHRQVARRAQNLDLAHIDLDEAGRHLGVLGSFGALAHG